LEIKRISDIMKKFTRAGVITVELKSKEGIPNFKYSI
jgi:hypothetical protein